MELRNPVFVNDEGFEWYNDELLNNKIPKSLKMKCFIVVKENQPISRVLVDSNKNIVYETSKLEDMGCKIEWLKLAKYVRKF